MPVQNVPKEKRAAYERCVAHVKAKNRSSGKKVNPYAVCWSSVVGGGVASAAKRRQSKKGG